MAEDEKMTTASASASASANAAAQPVQSIEVDESELVTKEGKTEEAEGDADGEGEGQGEAEGEGSDNDAPGEVEDETVDVTDLSDGKISNNLYKAFKAITEVLLNYKITTKRNEEYFPCSLFKRLPNKRLLPDYYDIIKEPSAISTQRGKIQRKQYTGVPEFVRDFALIVHNAQLYNKPNSQPVRDVLSLDELFKAELQKLVEHGFATAEDVRYPDLGDIPYASPEPDPISEDDGEDEADEDEEDDEADDSDDDKRKKKGRKGHKVAGKKGEDDEDDEKAADAEQRRRGRPPKVATPMEHRMDRILKSLKKPKAQNGQQMIMPFERLPDKAELPQYYEVITNPMAYDLLRKKAKRKKYQSIDEFMKDIELMFNNAMTFNEDGSDIHTWAAELLQEANRVEAEERTKPDSEYLQAAEGRIPLPHIIYKADMWKVGDWIHIQNPNDITKPIVAQIYRTWKTANDEEWINACWYYRPEQTIHQYEKHFYPNEVVKTGQYRDHKIEEVLNKCFVMFYTRYNRGRPRNLPQDTEVYVCEARYNEEKSKFNKIKTWASCLPDEVRDKDYEMDLFDAPRKIKKVPSPLLSRLKDDAKDTDELPQPEWKHANAPPLVGGIHKRPRDENQSPPPEPTPPPQPAPPPVHRTSSINHTDVVRAAMYQQQNPTMNTQAQHMRPAPSVGPQPSYSNTNANQYTRQNTHSATPQVTQPPSVQQTTQPFNQYTAQPPPAAPALAAAHPGNYSATPTTNYNRPAPSAIQPTAYNAQQVSVVTQTRTAEAYVLADGANASIPQNIREQFPRDDQGRVLFFTTPPLDTRHALTSPTTAELKNPLSHTREYMSALTARKRKFAETSKQSSHDVGMRDIDSSIPHRQRFNANSFAQNSPAQIVGQQTMANGISALANQMKEATYNEYMIQYGTDWRRILLADLDWADKRQMRASRGDGAAEKTRLTLANSHLQDKNRSNGQYAVNVQGYITDWQKSFFTGTYLDDYDSRLP